MPRIEDNPPLLPANDTKHRPRVHILVTLFGIGLAFYIGVVFANLTAPTRVFRVDCDDFTAINDNGAAYAYPPLTTQQYPWEP